MTAPRPEGWVQFGQSWGLWRHGRQIASVQPDAKGVRSFSPAGSCGRTRWSGRPAWHGASATRSGGARPGSCQTSRFARLWRSWWRRISRRHSDGSGITAAIGGAGRLVGGALTASARRPRASNRSRATSIPPSTIKLPDRVALARRSSQAARLH